VTELEPTHSASESPSITAPAPLLGPPPQSTRFWTKRRVIITVSAVLAILLAIAGCTAFTLARFLSDQFESSSALRPFIEEGYPNYRIVDSTRFGFILQHNMHESLRLDVRFVSADSIGVWKESPTEPLSSGWTTVETFFRHEEGGPADPRTRMNYDVDGFVEAYTPLRPGPNSVVSAVWLEDTDTAGIETYVVLVARRNRIGSYVEDMWPDHAAYFTRDSKTGEWIGTAFVPVEIENPN